MSVSHVYLLGQLILCVFQLKHTAVLLGLQLELCFQEQTLHSTRVQTSFIPLLIFS